MTHQSKGIDVCCHFRPIYIFIRPSSTGHHRHLTWLFLQAQHSPLYLCHESLSLYFFFDACFPVRFGLSFSFSLRFRHTAINGCTRSDQCRRADGVQQQLHVDAMEFFKVTANEVDTILLILTTLDHNHNPNS